MTMKISVISHLYQHQPKEFTPKQISDSLEMKNDSIRRTCLELDVLGFVKKSNQSKYSTSIKQAVDFIVWFNEQERLKLSRKSVN